MNLNLNSLNVDSSGRASFSGLTSGIDFQGVVDSIIAAKRIPIDTLETRVSDNEVKIASLQDLTSGMEALKTSLSTLYGKVSLGNTDDIFENKQAYASASRIDGGTASSASALLGVTVTNDASVGDHSIELLQPAKAHKVSSDSVSNISSIVGFGDGDQIVVNGNLGYRSDTQSSSTVAVGSDGTLEFTDVATGAVIGSVDYTSSETLTALASAIDNLDGVTAEVQQVGGQYQLRIDGDARFTIAETGAGSALTDLGVEDRNTVTLSSSDTLADVRDRINSANSGSDPMGVTASIVTVGTSEHYLLLTRDTQGETMTLEDVGSGDALQKIGILDSGGDVKNELQAAAKAQFYADGLLDFSNTAYESGLQSSSGALLGSAGTLTFTLDSDSSTIGTVNYAATDSLSDLADAINANVTGATAEVVADGAGYRLNITGDNAFSIADSGTVSSDLNLGNARRVIERDTNTVSDLFSGMTLNLFQAEQGTTVTLSVERDLSGIKTAIAQFVDAYNNLRGFINLQRISKDKATQDQVDAGAGQLIDSQALSTVDQTLQRIIGQGAAGVDPNYTVLSQVGVDLIDYNNNTDPQLRNTLTLDESKLDDALLNHLDDVRRLFTFDFSSSDSRVTLLNFDGNTSYQDGGYTLNLQPVSGTNLVPYSEQADNAYYTTVRASVVADDATAPDGSLTADGFVASTDNNSHLILPATSETLSAGTYTYSTYVKLGTAGTADSVRVGLSGTAFDGSGAYADFNLNDGTLTTLGSTAEGATIDSVGNDWYRVSVTATSASGGTAALERSARVEGQSSFAGANDTSNPELYLWGSQLSTPDTDNTLVTNFSTVRASVGTSGTVTAPNGTAANQIEASTDNNSHFVSNSDPVTVSNGQTYTMSALVQQGAQPMAMLRFDGSNFPSLARATFDLSNGTIDSIDSGADDASIEDLGNGWYRVSVTATASGDGNATLSLYSVTAGGGLGFVGNNDPSNPETYFSDLHMSIDGNEEPSSYVATVDSALQDVVASANIDGAGSGADDGSATLSGNKITVNSGNAKGLEMYYNGFSTAATVNLDMTVGVGAQLYFDIKDLLDKNFGAVQGEIDTLTDQNSATNDRIEEMQTRLDLQQQTLLQKYQRMETALSTAQRVLDSITQTTNALYANNKN